jgi:hypothetical protein
MRKSVTLTLLASLLSACATDPPPIPVREPIAPDPVSSSTTAAPTPEADPHRAASTNGELQFTAPDGWIAETPSSRMRKAQFRVPGESGTAADDASLVVFKFGGGGGGVEANVERWIAQFEQPDGSATKDAMDRATLDANGLEAHLVDIPGIYVAETTPGSGERVRHQNWRLVGAVLIDGDDGWFLKLVGPDATIARWRESFVAYVESARR